MPSPHDLKIVVPILLVVVAWVAITILVQRYLNRHQLPSRQPAASPPKDPKAKAARVDDRPTELRQRTRNIPRAVA